MLATLLSSALAIATPVAVPRPRVQTIAGARVVAVAAKAVNTRLGPPYTHVSVRTIGRPGDLMLPPGPVQLVAGAIQGPWPRARVCVRVSVVLAGRRVQTAVVWFAVKAFEPANTFGTAAPRDTPATALTLRREPVDVARADAPPLVNVAALQGLRLRHAVRAGQLVTLRDFEPIPDVDDQQRVRVDVTYGPIHIDAIGTALAAGMKGASVPVILTGGHTPFRAEITGKGVVALEH